MFQPGTVFVVGAGASAEVGLPSGAGIINIIKESLSIKRLPDDRFRYPKLFSAFGETCENNPDDYNLCIDAAQKIVDGTAYAVSIDNFLHTHKEDKYIQIVGKIAIANAILQAEQASKLRPTVGTLYPSSVENTWFKKFARKLFEGQTKYQLPKLFDGIEIVCFNYDRCIEHFLRHAVMSYFSVTMEESEEFVSNLRIHRPYGTVGDLPITKQNGDRKSSGEDFGFGNEFDGNQLIEASKRIRTFTEGTQDNESLNAIQNCMKRARHVIFLGFGYISQNMSLLQANISRLDHPPTIRGTAYGISDDDRKIIERKVSKIYGPIEGRDAYTAFLDIKLENIKCTEFFDQRWHELG